MIRTIVKMTGGWLRIAAFTAGILLLGVAANAEPTIQFIGNVFPWDSSVDGSVVVGNVAGIYAPFRWTAETGVVVLDTIGGGAGTPDCSADGQKVSATVLDPDSLYTQAIWTKGMGWEYLTGSFAPDGTGGASCWGMSYDGTTATGFYWRSNADGLGSAHANTWSPVGGFTPLPIPVRNCRGNDLNHDGSMVVGWSERFDGVWQPTLWEDGAVTVLHHGEWSSEANGVSNDGNTIYGFAHDTLSNHVDATLWVRNGENWDEHHLGVLPGTFPGYGKSIPYDMTANQDIIVGWNSFDWGTGTSFVWTTQQGIVEGEDYFAARGLVVPPNFHFESITAVSDDGRVFCGFGFDPTVFPSVWTGFIVRFDVPSDVPEVSAAQGLSIEANHPNPFNPSTTITLAIDASQDVSLEIYDARGRLIRSLPQGILGAGRHEVVWNGKDGSGQQLASGLYFARARTAQGVSQPHRMMLVK